MIGEAKFGSLKRNWLPYYELCQASHTFLTKLNSVSSTDLENSLTSEKQGCKQCAERCKNVDILIEFGEVKHIFVKSFQRRQKTKLDLTLITKALLLWIKSIIFVGIRTSLVLSFRLICPKKPFTTFLVWFVTMKLKTTSLLKPAKYF